MWKANFAKKEMVIEKFMFLLLFKNFYFIFGPAIDRESSPQIMVEGFRYYIGSILLKGKKKKKGFSICAKKEKSSTNTFTGFSEIQCVQTF